MTQKYSEVTQNQRSSLEVSLLSGLCERKSKSIFIGTGRKVGRGGVGVMGGNFQGQRCEVLIRTEKKSRRKKKVWKRKENRLKQV